MDISIEKTNDCQATLSATVPAEEITKLKEDIASNYMRSASVPGFRPGKAPKKVIAKRYASAINEECEARLKEQIQEKALSDNPELKVLEFGAPEASFGEDGSYSLSSEMTIVPSFELPEYMGLKISVPSTEVSDEEVAETLQQYANSSAKFEACERAAAMGDVAVIDFTTTVEGKPTAEFCGKSVGFMEGREAHWQTLEEDSFMPGLNEGIVGLNAGESKDITVTIKEDFPIEELSGKELTFSVKVTEVREKIVPEITEELFAAVLPEKSLDEIKEIVRENLVANKERSNEEAKADQISEQLADQLTFALPEAFVERENENTVQRKMYAAMQAGDYSIMQKMDELKESSRTETERNLRVYFALQEIANKESVVATDQELIQEVSRMAEQAKEKDLRRFFTKLQKENRVTGIRLSIVTSKVIDLLARNAVVETAEQA
ncbi:MAG: trigger factor [Akkermansia sp.]